MQAYPKGHVQVELPCLGVALLLVAAAVLEIGVHVLRLVPTCSGRTSRQAPKGATHHTSRATVLQLRLQS
jgi:hypothetical protein